MTNETGRERRSFAFHGYDYIPEPLGCKYDQRWDLENIDKLSQCHNNNRTLFFTGDSHMRMNMQWTDARLAGHPGTKYNPKFNDIRALYFPSSVNVSAQEMKETFYQENLNVLFHGNENLTSPVPPRFVLNMAPYGPEANEPQIPYPIEYPTRLNTTNQTEIYYTASAFLEHLQKNGFDMETSSLEFEKLMLPYDTFAFNFGAWAMHPEFMGVCRFFELWTNTLTRANSNFGIRWGKAPLDVIWMGIDAFPYNLPGQDPWHTWRSNQRIAVWTQYAEKLAIRRGYKRINTFGATLPWSQYYPAQDAIIDEFFHKLNLCGNP
ncbi:hypothetical protein BCR33DRAFT_713734 [Rhizoclosmatium globosum]|uniref:Uncharacterized protein n=1 Tax=Rhizoclosmatium globosum TaxID=329046 RepID=A0A1Y2CQT0_9FUNG|nr:hypothetical protein BCR33DRAFT_713734 [Rhizoclosmatium globosum]|eukprot:ORY49399.1 hypothetical protein BCR33DRAFT_713734 [Rhizoclosmatium globosum]